MSIAATFDIRQFDLDDIIQCIRNAGYIDDAHDFLFARYHGAYAYVGVSPTDKHRFMIGFRHDDDTCYVTSIYIKIGQGGRLIGEYSGKPDFESADAEKVLTFIEVQANK